MVCKGEEGVEDSEVRARSFRYEDYSNRRVFLRSYPLYWEEKEEEDADVGVQKVMRSRKKEKRSMKERVFTVFHWRGKLFLLRKLRNKVAYYLVACHPFGGLKPSHQLASV